MAQGLGLYALVSRPVEVDGYRLLDGGVVDAIPYHFLVEQGYDRNVVVLTQPKKSPKSKNLKKKAKSLSLDLPNH